MSERNPRFGAERDGGGYPGHWTGRFIWTSDDPYARHYFVRARKEFVLESEVSAAALHITANDRYVLHINGEYVGRGPARSDCRWKSYDTHDVGERLRPGPNCIAIVGYHYGCPNAYTRDDRSGLFAQLDITLSDGVIQVIGADDTWRVCEAKTWRRDVGPINGNVGLTEVYDARAEPVGWTEPGFDDADWNEATVVPPRLSPWGYLEPRQTPLMVEREVFPVRVVEVGEILEDSSPPGEADVPERLAMEPHLPLNVARITHVDELLTPEGGAVVRSAPCCRSDPRDRGVRSPYVVVDFGRHVFGFPKVHLSGPAGGIVEMTYGPELIGGRILPVAGHRRYGDRYVMREGEQVWQQFEYKQFRYVQIVFRNVAQAAFVHSVSLVSYEYPAERRGQFACSDPVLTSVWKAAVDTTHLQMEDTIVCDAVRERSSWGGDGAHGEYGVWAGFGDTAICDWHFRLLFRGQMADGMLAQRYPCTQGSLGSRERQTKAAVFDNPHCIPQHALVLAVMVTGEYYRNFGRIELLQDLYPALKRLAAWCERHADETGLMYKLGNWNWMDWTRCDLRGANFQTNAFYLQLLANLSIIAKDLGNGADADRWSARAQVVRESLRRGHWDPVRGLFVDSVLDGRRSDTATELANGLSLLFGIATPEQQASVLSHMKADDSVLVPATPLFVYYVLEGLAAAGDAEEAYDLIRARYGPMMAYDDAPTIWEAWAPHTLVLDHESEITSRSMIPSRTHSGGVGVAWTLSKHALGVQSTLPGFAGCRIEPQTESLVWAKGVVPSVRGDIKVSWQRAGQCTMVEATLPEGLPAEIVLVRDPASEMRAVHNGQRFSIPPGASSVPGIRVVGDRVVFEVVGGYHSVAIGAA